MENVTEAVRARFWAKVEKTGDGGSEGCWLWKAGRFPYGHGRFNIAGKNMMASRASWFIHNGDIGEGLSVCHTCPNPGCVRPSHLYLGTTAENLSDGNVRRRGAARLADHRVSVRATQYKSIQEMIIGRSVPLTESGCWIWEKTVDKNGYGVTHIPGHRKLCKAYRLSYEAFVGPIPKGMLVLHSCDVPSCCNYEHLSVGTHKDNHQEREAKGRHPHAPDARSKLDWEAVNDIRSCGTRGEMAEKYGIRPESVNHIRHGNSWKQEGYVNQLPDRRKKLSPEDIKDIRSGGSPKALALKYAINVNQIHTIRRGEQWKGQPIGPQLPNASIKFSSEDITAICECASVKDAMARFGISQSYAFHLRRRQRLEV